MSDELKIRKGLKTLKGGNLVQKLFGNANYDQILRSYKKEFIQTRRRKDGTTYLYHTSTKKVITEAEIQDDIELKFTGTKTPFKDANYLAAKRRYRRLLSRRRRKLGIMGRGGKDVSHKKGRLTLEIPKRNRARGGAKRK